MSDFGGEVSGSDPQLNHAWSSATGFGMESPLAVSFPLEELPSAAPQLLFSDVWMSFSNDRLPGLPDDGGADFEGEDDWEVGDAVLEVADNGADSVT